MSDDLRVIGRRSDRGPEAAVVPERMLAGAIDFAILACVGWLLTLPAYVLSYQHSLWPDIVLIATAIAMYFIGFEWLLQATPGKLLFGLRVRRIDGGPPGFVPVVVRNVLRVVDGIPIFYVLGLVVIGSTQRAQRLGDLAARTIIAKKERGAAPTTTADRVVTGVGIVSWILLWAFFAVVLSWLTAGNNDAALVVFLFLAGTTLIVFGRGGRQTRYGVLSMLVCVAAGIGAYAYWTDREALANDDRSEIRATLEETVPIGSTESAALAALADRHKYIVGPKTHAARDGNYYGLDLLEPGERYIRIVFKNAFYPPWFCSEGDYVAILVFEQGVLTEFRYRDFLGGCL